MTAASAVISGAAAKAPSMERRRKAITEAVVQCLQQQLQSRFRLPDNFLQIRQYANNVQTVALHNPFTHADGILLDIHPRGVSSSNIKLYANGTTLSRAWRNLPNGCK